MPTVRVRAPWVRAHPWFAPIPWLALAIATFALPGVARAQSDYGVVVPPPPDGSVELGSAEVPRIRVVPITTELEYPWGMAFRRNGDILVTERDAGRLRIIRDGRLLEADVPGVPAVYSERWRAGLMDVALHPDDDALVYLSYTKPIVWEGLDGLFTVALARGRLVDDRLTDV
ncbi:MAG TPA: PQQ-dependent sugar dehydrogenase, partial [Candidatus Thermoplasmatota archaeon]